MSKPQMDMLDITKPKHGVAISIREDGKVIWIDADGVCVLRICQIPRLEVLKGEHWLVRMEEGKEYT